jgi:hypothetical protein
MAEGGLIYVFPLDQEKVKGANVRPSQKKSIGGIRVSDSDVIECRF